MRRLVAFGVAAATLASGLITAAVINADTGTNPHVKATITKVSDGTGHGTAAQTFITSANGYAVGDDTPTDGVVSSNDTVTYSVNLDFASGLARTVNLNLSIPSYLSWSTSGDTLCRDFGSIKATRSGNTCSFQIPRGAVFSTVRTLTLTAADTGGSVQKNQTVKIGVRQSTDTTDYASSSADPVTVVSAPAVDMYATDGVTAYKDDTATGSFTFKGTGLSYKNSASSKGISTSGAWRGTVDVSSFPDGTTWKLNGTSVTASNGKIPVSGKGINSFVLSYEIAGGYPDLGTSVYKDYDIHVDLDKTSYSADGSNLLNNGSGYDPGSNQDRDKTTQDASIGSNVGQVYLNNNWTRLRVTNEHKPKGSILTKSITRPKSLAGTLFEDVNKLFSLSNASTADGAYNYVDANTQLSNNVTVNTSAIDGIDPASNSLIIGDVWNAKTIMSATEYERQYQRYDTSRSVTVTYSGGTKTLSPAQYTLQWSNDPASKEQDLTDKTSKVWRTGNPGSDAVAVRVLVKSGAWSLTDGPYMLTIPTRIITVDDQGNESTDDGASDNHFNAIKNNGDVIPDRGSMTLWANTGADPKIDCGAGTSDGSCTIQRTVIAIAPKAPKTSIVLSTNDDGKTNYSVGSTISYQASSQATNVRVIKS
jgi:hypothetical protein